MTPNAALQPWKKVPWLQLRIAAHNAQVGRIEAALESLGALSVILGDAADQALLEPGPGETPLWAEVTITGLFKGDNDPEALRAALETALPEDHRQRLDWRPWRISSGSGRSTRYPLFVQEAGAVTG